MNMKKSCRPHCIDERTQMAKDSDYFHLMFILGLYLFFFKIFLLLPWMLIVPFISISAQTGKWNKQAEKGRKINQWKELAEHLSRNVSKLDETPPQVVKEHFPLGLSAGNEVCRTGKAIYYSFSEVGVLYFTVFYFAFIFIQPVFAIYCQGN